MLKYGLSAALLIAAVPAFAQDHSAPSGPPAAIQQAAQAFGTCVETGIRGLAAAVAPEAGATSVLGACATQRAALVTAVEGMITSLPAENQAAARTQLQTRLAAAEGQVAELIRRSRAAPAAPAAAQ